MLWQSWSPLLSVGMAPFWRRFPVMRWMEKWSEHIVEFFAGVQPFFCVNFIHSSRSSVFGKEKKKHFRSWRCSYILWQNKKKNSHFTSVLSQWYVHIQIVSLVDQAHCLLSYSCVHMYCTVCNIWYSSFKSLNVYTRQNPRRHVVLKETSQMRTICTQIGMNLSACLFSLRQILSRGGAFL